MAHNRAPILSVGAMSALGQSRPIIRVGARHVRYASNSDHHPSRDRLTLPTDLALTAEIVSELGPLSPNSGRAPCLLWVTPG